MPRYILSTILIAVVAVIPVMRVQAEPQRTPPALEEIFNQEFESVLGRDAQDPEVIKHKARLDEVLSLLVSGSQSERYEADVALRRFVQKSDLPQLLKALPEYSPYEFAQRSVIAAIGKLGDPVALKVLAHEFELSKRPIQLAIVDAMGEIRDDSVVELLSRLLRNSKDLEYLKRALAALAKIGGEKAVYVIQSSYSMLPEGAAKITATWAMELAKRQVDLSQIDSDLQQGRSQRYQFKETPFYFFRPTAYTKESPAPWLLVCVHGADLSVEAMFNRCMQLGKQYKLAVLAPLFDPIFFPDYQNLNIMGMRADLRLIELLEHLQRAGQVRTREIYLYGTDLGGEFVQRFTLAHTDRIARAAFFTQSFVAIDPDQYYPAGLKPPPVVADLKFDLERIVKTDFAILTDPTIQNGKPFRLFYNGLVAAADAYSLASRVRIRKIQQTNPTSDMIWTEANQFLFPNY